MFGQPFVCGDEQDTYVRLLDGFDGTDEAVKLDGFFLFIFSVDACGVDEDEVSFVLFIMAMEGVAGGMGAAGDDAPLLVEKGVDKG